VSQPTTLPRAPVQLCTYTYSVENIEVLDVVGELEMKKIVHLLEGLFASLLKSMGARVDKDNSTSRKNVEAISGVPSSDWYNLKMYRMLLSKPVSQPECRLRC
jgi:hypothetical protein